jgi:hypothetical protein
MKFLKFQIKIFASKSANKRLRYHQKKVEKHCISPKNLIKNPLENHDFIQVSHVFQPSFDDISAI